LTEPPKKKVKLLKPEQIPQVILDSDSDESEDDSNERVDREKDYEFDESDQSLLQHEQAPSQSSYTGSSALPLLKRHTAPVHPMSPRKKKDRISQIN
jgi:hypothetical protein